jgi:hypothetical protein
VVLHIAEHNMKLNDLFETQTVDSDVRWIQRDLDALRKKREREAQRGADSTFTDRLIKKLERALMVVQQEARGG